MRENAAAKGRRLLAEGRLRVTLVAGGVIAATCLGDSAEQYQLGFEAWRGWHCSCPARGRCSHLSGLMLVTIRPAVAA
jgi:hypothetical protein